MMFDNEFISNNNAAILSGEVIQPRYKPPTCVQPQKTFVSDNNKTFMTILSLYQYKKTLTEIYQLCDLPAGTGSRVAKHCEKNHLIKIIQLSFKKGRPKYPVLLPEAYKILGIKEKIILGKGAGYEHTLYQHLITDHLAEFKPIIELNRQNKLIDVGLYFQEKLICIEVAMTATHEKENLIKDFNLAKAECVVVACQNPKVLNQIKVIKSQLPKHLAQKTEICMISELLNFKPAEFISERLTK